MSRREAMNSSMASVVSSAYTWSPRKRTKSGQDPGSPSRSPSAILSAKARIESTPCVRLPGASWPTLVRQDPNAMRSGFPGCNVAITLGGNGEDGSGHTVVPSTSTS